MRISVDMFEPCRLTAPLLAGVAFTSLRTAGSASAAAFTALPTCIASGFMLSPGTSLAAAEAVASTFSGDSFCLGFVGGLSLGFLLFCWDPVRAMGLGKPLAPLVLVASFSVLPVFCPGSCFCGFAVGVFGLAARFLGVAFARTLPPLRLTPSSGLLIDEVFFLALSALFDFALGLLLDSTCAAFLPFDAPDLPEGVSACFLDGELDLDAFRLTLVLVGMRERELLR